jgi:beta-glucosidase
MNQQVEALLNQMTLEEKISLAAGATFWTTVPVERLGIPALKVTDGPNGARGGSWNGDVTSASFPVGIALSATWNTDLITRVGQALAEESRSKGASVLLGPTVNIHRSPLNGRNFECYSEDPHLSARIAVAYIKGLQQNGVAACIKHFVCNDSEFERQSISSEVTERALREIYLPPFQAAVQEAGTWALMTAYNKVNGTYASENTYLLKEILKGEWGFDGLVMSDWFGTNSTVEAANAGLDLEMPGPARWMGADLLAAVRDGQVDEATLDDKVRRLLRLMIRVGALDNSGISPERAENKPEHHVLLREAAAESIVLLKNDRLVLPLDPAKINHLAIIGSNAKFAQIQGGGSAQVTPHYTITPFEGVMNYAGEKLEIGYEVGYVSYKMLPLVESQNVCPAPGSSAQGFKAEFFKHLDFVGELAYTRTYRKLNLMWMGDDVPPGIEQGNFSVRLTGVFTAAETGIHTFSLVSSGLSRLFVDGKEIVDNWTAQQPGEAFFGMGSTEVRGTCAMTAGQSYRVQVDYTTREARLINALRIGCLTPVPTDTLERAVKLAAGSDVAVVFAGLGSDWESEGTDRPNMDLPSTQNELIAKVAAVNPNTVVVLNTGSPITMPWLDEVAAVLQAWYPGQECGNAIADVLFGVVNPSGRLPQTFPRRLEDNPAFINYPGENGKVHYGEGAFVGYRYYDKKKVRPLFSFGYGLSYTTFAYDNLMIPSSPVETTGAIPVTVDVTNTGSRAGQEVVQLYVRDPASRLARPEKELKAFAKVRLQPGETQTVTFALNEASLSYYDPAKRGWVAERGTFEVLLGSASDDIRVTGTFALSSDVLNTVDSNLATVG